MNLLKRLGFGPPDPDISWMSIPDFGWPQTESNDNVIRWSSADGASGLSQHFFNLTPDIPVPFQDIDGLRRHYRSQIVPLNGGLVKLEVIKLHGINVMEFLFKAPMEPFGMCYIGFLTIPFRDCSFEVQVTSKEQGVTGLRDSLVANKYADEGHGLGFAGWFEDPYDPGFKEGRLMNLSEKEEWDEKFPQHPLSIVRSKMVIVKSQITFNKGIFKLPPF